MEISPKIEKTTLRKPERVTQNVFLRPEDLHTDTKRPSGAGRLFQLQGVPLLREAELHRGLQEEQRDEPRQEQPGKTLPLFGTSADVPGFYVRKVLVA